MSLIDQWLMKLNEVNELTNLNERSRQKKLLEHLN